MTSWSRVKSNKNLPEREAEVTSAFLSRSNSKPRHVLLNRLHVCIAVLTLLLSMGVVLTLILQPPIHFPRKPRNTILFLADGLTQDQQLLLHKAQQQTDNPTNEWERSGIGSLEFTSDAHDVQLGSDAKHARKAIGYITTGNLFTTRPRLVLLKNSPSWEQWERIAPILLVGGGANSNQKQMAAMTPGFPLETQPFSLVTSYDAWTKYTWEEGSRLVALLESRELSYTIDSEQSGDPTLANIVEKGLRYMQSYNHTEYDGFFLVVHLTNIQRAVDANDFGALLREVSLANTIIAILREFTYKNPDTLAIGLGFPVNREEFIADPSLLPLVLCNRASIAKALSHPRDSTFLEWLAHAFTLTKTSRYMQSLKEKLEDNRSIEEDLKDIYMLYFLMYHQTTHPKNTVSASVSGNAFMIASLYTQPPKERTVAFIVDEIQKGFR